MTMMAPEPEDPNARYGVCPRCGEKTLRLDRPVLNALSRTDNRTYVCSDCGTGEALESFAKASRLRGKEAW